MALNLKMPTASSSGRKLAVAIVMAISIAILGFAIALSGLFGASSVAANARSLHWTNAALGGAGIARASVAQGVFFAAVGSEATGGDQAISLALDEARINLTSLKDLADDYQSAPAKELSGALVELEAIGDDVIGLAESGDVREADALRLSQFEPAFLVLVDELRIRQSELQTEISSSDESLNRIGRITQVAVTLLIPGVAMVGFWWVLRRRVKARESTLEAKLIAERDINRAKDEFIAGLSHELRTPLTTIVGFSEVLLESEETNEDSKEMLSLINAGSADLARMVDDLLAAARIDAEALSSRPQHVDLKAQVEMVVAPYVRTGETIDVRVQSIEVYADPLHVRQIVHNLVSNARRHGGGSIVVSGRAENGTALLVVADDGPGVSAEIQQKLFQRFVNKGRMAKVAGSIGLGLAISQELAMRMGGAIRYDRVDEWTTFTLKLPVFPTRESPQPAGGADILSSAE